MALHASRGYESDASKMAMRATVLLSDLLCYFPAALAAAAALARRGGLRAQLPLATGLLLGPALVIIDHGHFQYNCISLGAAAGAAAAVAAGHELLGATLFCASLNHKQMSLYFAPAFFAYLLGRCLERRSAVAKVGRAQEQLRGGELGRKRGMASYGGGDAHASARHPPKAMLLAPSHQIIALARIGLTVLSCFALAWAPFLRSRAAAAAVLSRIFPTQASARQPAQPALPGPGRPHQAASPLSRSPPASAPLQRGLYEDYVANFWCASSRLVKWKALLTTHALVRACAAATAAAFLPAAATQVARPTPRGFLLCMANSALAFFLFSFQVRLCA